MLSLSINHGVVKGRLPLKLYSGSDGMHVRTDENLQVFAVCRKTPGVDKGPQPLMFNLALTTCASERMKTQRFSYFAGFAARERMREAKPVKLKKVAFSHFF